MKGGGKKSHHAILRNTDIDCILKHNFNSFNFFESWKASLIHMVVILMMQAKLVTLGLLKIKTFWNKGYGVIISAHDVTNRILLRDSNKNVDVVI